MRIFLILALIICSGLVYSQDITVRELICVNEEGGVIALTTEPCMIEKAKSIYKMQHKSYATESNGTVHEGCWDRPDTSAAPKVPGVKIIPIVNTYWIDEDMVISYPAELFHPPTGLGDMI